MAIEILPSEVVDQIAAGEVIERPAQLLKELVENSLDAGATVLEVEFDHGGRKVLVKDNGSGMAKEDLALSLARHATSKIRRSEDLWQLSSFGFRGEALASISSVCRIQLTSRPHGQEGGYRLSCEYGKVGPVEAVSAEPGTAVLVRDLFENLPARLKFLKSDAAEAGQIKTILKALALAHPQVEFRIRTKGELIHYWPAQAELKTRVEQVLEAQDLYWTQGELDGYRLKALVSAPHKTVRNNRQLWFFAQNRYIHDRALQAAVMEAYRSLLMHGEYPVAALWVDCSPEDIDVNIHPTKSQIKFREQDKVFRLVVRALRQTLEGAPWLENVLGKNQAPLVDTTLRGEAPSEMEALLFNDPILSRTQYAVKEALLKNQVRDLHSEYRPSVQVGVEPLQREQRLSEGSRSGARAEANPGPITTVRWGDLPVLGQARLTYILAQSDRSLLLVDQHAAHERVLYERFMRAWSTGDIEVQQHLLPLTVDLGEEELEAVLKVTSDLERLGLAIDQMGPGTIGVRSAPSALESRALARTFEVLAREMVEQGGSFAFDKVVRDICATMACHSAVRAGQALALEQMQILLVQLDEFPLSSFCPHGRPVFVEYLFSRIEREFGRIV